MYFNILRPLLILGTLLTPLIHAVPVKLEARAVDEGTLANLNFYSQFCKATYFKPNTKPPNGNLIVCADGSCPLVQADKVSTFFEFENIGYTDTTGYIAIDNVRKVIVLVFRGSISVREFFEDAQFFFAPYEGPGNCDGCKVHFGFQEGWKVVKSLVQPVFDSAIQKYPGYPVIFTGHSLGAALATLAAADLRVSGYKIALYNYGSPMVGNIPFANFVTAQSGGNYRVTNKEDIVPKLPGYPLSYAHISPEYWLTSPNLVPVRTTDVQVSSGAQNIQGNAGTLVTNPADHVFYFGCIGLCALNFEIY